MPHKARLASQGKPGMRQVHVTEETEAPDEEHEAFFVYAVLYRCPEVMLASASTSHGYMIVDTACQRTCHGQGWMEAAPGAPQGQGPDVAGLSTGPGKSLVQEGL